jgi:hypothetical protein
MGTFSVIPPSGLPAISPTRGEIGWRAVSPNSTVAVEQCPHALPISPLVGEMAGRPEGGERHPEAIR